MVFVDWDGLVGGVGMCVVVIVLVIGWIVSGYGCGFVIGYKEFWWLFFVFVVLVVRIGLCGIGY